MYFKTRLQIKWLCNKNCSFDLSLHIKFKPKLNCLELQRPCSLILHEYVDV